MTIQPYSDGVPVTVSPLGAGTSGASIEATVTAPSGVAVTRGVTLKLQASPDGSNYGDAGNVCDGYATAELIPVGAGATTTQTFSVSVPGAQGLTVTPHNGTEQPLTVTLSVDAY